MSVAWVHHKESATGKGCNKEMCNMKSVQCEEKLQRKRAP